MVRTTQPTAVHMHWQDSGAAMISWSLPPFSLAFPHDKMKNPIDLSLKTRFLPAEHLT